MRENALLSVDPRGREPLGPWSRWGELKGGTLRKRAGPRTKGAPKKTNPWVELAPRIYSCAVVLQDAEHGIASCREHLGSLYYFADRERSLAALENLTKLHLSGGSRLSATFEQRGDIGPSVSMGSRAPRSYSVHRII